MLPATHPGGERATEANAPRDRAPANKEAPSFGIYIAFVPWVLFTLITQHDTLKAAAVVALLASAAIALPSVLTGRPKLLELGAVLALSASRSWPSPPTRPRPPGWLAMRGRSRRACWR